MAGMAECCADLTEGTVHCKECSVANMPPAAAMVGFRQRAHSGHARPGLLTADARPQWNYYSLAFSTQWGMLQRSILYPVAVYQPSWDRLRATPMPRLLLTNPPVSILAFLFMCVTLALRPECSPCSPLYFSQMFSLVNLLHM